MPPVLPVVPGPVVLAVPYKATAKDPKISAPLTFSGKSSEFQNFLFAIRKYVQIKVNELPDERARLPSSPKYSQATPSTGAEEYAHH